MVFRLKNTKSVVLDSFLSLVICMFFAWSFHGSAQVPFSLERQVFLYMENSFQLNELTINPSNNALKFVQRGSSLGRRINAIGFRSTDGWLYGIDEATFQLCRLDASGTLEMLKKLNLDPSYRFVAGDITPDGNYLMAIGSLNGTDQQIIKVDLTNADYKVESIGWISPTWLSDIAFHPSDNLLYGYDAKGRRFVKIDLSSYNLELLSVLEEEYEVQGLYFNTFGELFALGTAQFGVASGLFTVELSTGNETIYTTGPENYITDLASVNVGVDMRNKVFPEITFPCSDLTYTISIANQSGTVFQGINFQYELPDGFTFKQLVVNPFGGIVTTSSNSIQIVDMIIEPGIHELVIRGEVGDVEGNRYKSQAKLSGLPEKYGSLVVSDDPATLIYEDSTSVKVNKITEDSLFFSKFLCLGETLILDGSEYGNNLRWSDGSYEPMKSVTEAGVYVLQAISACQTTTITYKVTTATCPYTIEMSHVILPPITLPCNEVIFQFALENETGIRHDGLTFYDTLPAGFEYVEMISDPLGGQVKQGQTPNILIIENMSLDVGMDSLIFVVRVGNVAPGNYSNQAVLKGFPVEIGPLRFSDDPTTLELDPTTIEILGVESDTFFVDKKICAGRPLILDADPFGIEPLWFDGSSKAQLEVYNTGIYHLRVFDGCEETNVFFQVGDGPRMEVQLPELPLKVRLGEQVKISPEIYNEGDTLVIEWRDSSGSSLDCNDCLEQVLMPLTTTYYTIIADNLECWDSTRVDIRVDNTRRVYTPNAFSPNNDGVNDRFYIQSPDYGIVQRFVIYDRWGRKIYENNDFSINDDSSAWDGTYKGRPLQEGLYLWEMWITFLDNISSHYAGEIFLLK